MKKKTLEELFDIVTLEYVEEDPLEAYNLMQWMFIELNNRKNVIQEQENLIQEQEKSIQVLRQRVLLLNALLMDEEEEEKDGNN